MCLCLMHIDDSDHVYRCLPVAYLSLVSLPAVGPHWTGDRQPSPAAIRSLPSALHISLDEVFDAMGTHLATAHPAATVAAGSGWTPNKHYSAGGSGTGKLQAVSAFASAPHAPAPDRKCPVTMAEAADGVDASADGVIAEVMDVLAARSPQERLEAASQRSGPG